MSLLGLETPVPLSALSLPSPFPRVEITTIHITELGLDSNYPVGGARTSSVFRGTYRGSAVATKIFVQDTPYTTLKDYLARHHSLQHPNVLEILGLSTPEADLHYIVTPLCHDGNVAQFLTRNPNAERPKLVRDVAQGMAFLHSRGVVHGSLSPPNVLIEEGGRACIADCSMVEIQSSSNKDAHRYFSPEAWKGTVSRPSDVFAFAMTSYEMFTSKKPWGVLSERHVFHLLVEQDNRPDPPLPDHCIRVGLSDQIWGLIEECWQRESIARPTFDTLVKMWHSPTGQLPRKRGPVSSFIKIPKMNSTTVSHASLPAPIQAPRSILKTSAVTTPALVRQQSCPTIATSEKLVRTTSTSKAHISTPPVRQQTSPAIVPSEHLGRMLSTTTIRSLPLGPRPPSYDTATAASQAAQRPRKPSFTARPLPTPAINPPVQSRPHLPIPPAPMTPPPPAPANATLPSSGLPPPEEEPQIDGLLEELNTYAEENVIYCSSWSATDGSTSPISSSPGHSPLPLTPSSPPPGFGDRSEGAGRVFVAPYGRAGWDSVASLNSQQVWAPKKFPDSEPPSAGSSSFHSIHSSPSMRSTSFRSTPSLRRPPPLPGLALSTKSGAYSSRGPSFPQKLPRLDTTAPPTPLSSTWMSNDTRFIGEMDARATAAGLQAEAALPVEKRNYLVLEEHLRRIQESVQISTKDGEKLVTAGVIPIVASLLKQNGTGSGEGLTEILAALGYLAFDAVSAHTVYRTDAVTNLVDIYRASLSDEISCLALWCLARVSRSQHIAEGMIKRNLVKFLLQSRFLIQTDVIADALADRGAVTAITEHLNRVAISSQSSPADFSAALFALSRMSRSIKLAKMLTKGGVEKHIAHFLKYSIDPEVLNWAARAVGSLMRPNSSDLSKMLIKAGIPEGLARLPSVLPSDVVEPLASFAFCIQRFSCAEWGDKTRKALVEAGVVDSLLAALRTAADEPYPTVHVELALAVSFLGDIGGAAVRKEIINAGGVSILKRVGGYGTPEVTKACDIAVTSITGNILSRNAASIKTTMAHTWNGGCPDHSPPCPRGALPQATPADVSFFSPS